MPLTRLQVTTESFAGAPDVQQTSFSLDVMGRFICNTFQEATSNPDFDVVVIGAGMYGGYSAAKLYTESDVPGRTPLRVLVLEAGPFLVHEHGQNIPDLSLSNPFRSSGGVDQPEPRHLVWGTGWVGNEAFPGTAYCVGGKSLYWGGWCPRLQEADLAQWPRSVKDYLISPPTFGRNLPNRLAPPAPASVYEAVEFEIGVQPADDYVFDPVAGPDEPPDQLGLNAALKARLLDALDTLRQGPGTPLQDPVDPPIAVQTQSFVSGVFSPDKYSSLTLLISALRNARGQPDAQARLFLVPRTHVARLIVDPVERDGAQVAGYRVSGIDLFVNGVRQFLPIKPTCTVVLGLGCIESTRLALESFPTAAQRPEQDELIGRNLMAHLRFDFPFHVDRAAFAQWVQQATGKTLRDRLQTASFHLQADTPDGRFHLQVYGTGDASGSAEGLLYRMIPDAELAQRLADRQDPNRINLIFRACGEMKGDRSAKVHASGTSWIDLASPADRDHQFDHARAFVHYADQADAPIWQRMRDACLALAAEMGGSGIQPEDRHQVGSTWHDAGTLFMGDDPELSVTDVNGHLHHIANVACVDQALFPTVGSANPVLTGLCLARKVAETIVDRQVSTPLPGEDEVAQEKAQGFRFLLEGAEVTKWQPNHPRFTEKQPALIENGSILEVHGQAGLGVLFYDDPDLFTDFELRLQWKAFLEPGSGEMTANSGIFLRTPRPSAELDAAGFYDRAIEIQIDDTGYDAASRRLQSPRHRTGAVYSHVPARVWTQKMPSREGMAGHWNEYRITARGTRVAVQLNGQLISEGDVPAALSRSGMIGLQYHTGKVQFRAVRIRQL
ncbi:family 16 glycoside hydrolase [Geminicoccus flavidas]|uniref:family 16 glycoside hydrolase n=1 Tax=Geminicoccus flavidas TaxID=2506407 RepID=UPI00135BED9C|nr:family 16 glycoside hydrolase [Geminicoccus flavidas]